jgi:hypothetical protein
LILERFEEFSWRQPFSFNEKNQETFEKCPILVKVKEGDDFNRRNILNISRIKI